MTGGRDGGFTLVEALVALTIVVLSLTVCYHMIGRSLRGLTAIKLREEAMMHALNHLEQLAANPSQVAMSGAYPNGMRWRIVPTELNGSSSARPKVQWLDLWVTNVNGSELARLQTAVIKPVEP